VVSVEEKACVPENAVDSAGTGGVGLGFITLWDYLMITEFVTIRLESGASWMGHINNMAKTR